MSKLIVYLVHGTWPYGPFGKETKDGPVPWFRSGSEFAEAIIPESEDDFEIRTFTWSGKNSFQARSDAAAALAEQMVEDSLGDAPETGYIVVAHSHGGTVAANALGRLVELPLRAGIDTKAVLLRTKALICMGTPFAYWSIAGMTQRKVFVSSTTAIIVSLLMIVSLQLFPNFAGEHPILFSTGFFTFGVLLLLFRIVRSPFRGQRTADYEQMLVFPPNVTVYALRAPQDEATLVIGFTQALQGIAREYFKLADQTLFATSTTYIVAAALLAGIPLLLAGQLLAPLLISGPANPSLANGVGTVLSLALAAVPYLVCHFLTALSVGYWKFSLWGRRTLDVDAAPPGVWTVVKVVEPDLQNEGLRHSLYQLQEVRNEIREGLSKFQRSVSGR
ncbi:MAG TPA: hypothetical protein VM469_10020 [Pseudoxanthomonas sp.]|nr:hypothetical protein [Pseudoxanthomonas sp.]